MSKYLERNEFAAESTKVRGSKTHRNSVRLCLILTALHVLYDCVTNGNIQRNLKQAKTNS